MGNIYSSKETMGQYIQETICRDDFLVLLEEWLATLDDNRMRLLHSLIYEVELSDTEMLVKTLYEYGGCLTERNYFGRKLFEQMVQHVRQLELNPYS